MHQIELEMQNDGIHVLDMQGNVVEANDSFCRILGYTPEEMASLNVADWAAQWSAKELRKIIKEITDRNVRFETVHRRKNGSLIDVEISSSGMEIEGQHFLFAASRDITERKQAEKLLRESEQRYRTLFENMVDGYAYCKILFEGDTARDFIYISVNSAFEKLTGLKAVTGKKVSELIPGIRESNPEILETYGRVVLTGVPERFETYVEQLGMWFFITIYRPEKEHFVAIFENITERKQIETERIKELNFINAVLDTAGVLVMVINRDGEIVHFNRTAEEFTGYTFDKVKDRPFFWETFLLPDQRQGVRAVFEGIKVERVVPYYENHWVSRDGGQRLFAWTNTLLCDIEEQMEFLITIGSDITERKKAEEKQNIAANVFTHAREGITITSADGSIIDVNDAFTRITGYSRDEVLGRNPRILQSGIQGKEFYAALWHDLIENGHWYGEIWNRRKNGEVYAEMLNINAVRDAQGNTYQYVALFSDITAFKQHERQLEHIAHYDALTTLPNRVLLADRLQQAMSQAQRRGQRLAVVYLDLDGFKAINDHHGHEAGDQLLMTVAIRMKQALREGDTLARLGGDEFVAVLLDLADIKASVQMFTRLLAAAAQPVSFGDIVLQVSASLGVTFYPQTEDMDADQLLRQADQAMYQAKIDGKNRYHVFDDENDRNVRSHHESLERIRHALSEREFVLYYQPKVNMRTGTVIGAEALIRWQHPEKGLLPPAVFLPVIEDHPLAVELGEWVIDSALTQMGIWRASGLNIPVSVNVGACQLQHADFVERLRLIMATHPNFKPGDLELEVLETSALNDLARVSQVIEDCRKIGVMFALDDFGTGYSSLTYLKRLPVTQLKIDQSFVRDMLGDPDDLAILDGVIGLAAAFRKQVIAEGVETPEHGEMLLRLGCELAQGYGIARPMPAHMLPDWTTDWQPDQAWANLISVNREDVPLLFASVEHRAWVTAIENHLRGESEIPPPLDCHQCHFGIWLDGEGLTRYGAQPVFKSIELLHQRVHTLAVHLLEHQTQSRNSEALTRLRELHGLRDALIEQLKTLAQEIQL